MLFIQKTKCLKRIFQASRKNIFNLDLQKLTSTASPASSAGKQEPRGCFSAPWTAGFECIAARWGRAPQGF
jgi:hypothetical protein